MSEWVDSTNYGWYEGIADIIPSTDNGLEATNNVVIINLNRTNWTDSKCSCSWFLKNYFCLSIILDFSKLI